MIKLHPSAHVSDLADIEDSIKGSIISIGEDSYVDAFVKIKAAGGLGNISIGKSTYINSGTVIYIGNGVSIGDHVSVAANCVIAPTNHEFSDAQIPIQLQGFMPSKGGISIEDDVWIGAGSIILDGSTLAKGSVVGAGSIVRGLTEPFGIYVGNPLRKIGSRS